MNEYIVHKNRNKEAWLLTMAILSVLGSAVFLFAKYVELETGYKLSLPVAAKPTSLEVMAVAPTVLQPTKSPEVLGATTQNCVSIEQYRKTVESVRPDIIVYDETTPYTVQMKEMLDCAKFSQQSTSSNIDECAAIKVDYEKSCVTALVNKINFAVAKEVLTSSDRKTSVQVRIADKAIDKEKLPDEMITAVQTATTYAAMTSPYVTLKSIVVQAPTTVALPNSDGLFDGRYIEVDGSRQLLFIWENGKYRSFRISGAYEEYNPVGVHYIVNKYKLAWSSTANKWMPYWMAFAFDYKQKAWLGFHALVFWYPGYKQTGTKRIYEPISNIGKPKSMGCLRMTEKNSKILYDWAKVGDWVVVHN